MIISEQIRAARAMLKLTAKELADKAGLSLPTVQRMESDGGIESAKGKSLLAIQHALEDAGIVFIQADERFGAGVRLKL
jgi:transcriptional regulator with XRE-family HTH domain